MQQMLINSVSRLIAQSWDGNMLAEEKPDVCELVGGDMIIIVKLDSTKQENM